MKAYPKFIAAAVAFVIVGMPFISYLYLREGLSFRIDSISALKQDDNELELTALIDTHFDLKEKMVNVLLNRNNINDNNVSKLYDKFKGNKYFFLNTYSLSADTFKVQELKEKYTELYLNKRQNEIISNFDMILLDTSGSVRQTYINGTEEFKTFVQHLSVLLPVESSKKIILER